MDTLFQYILIAMAIFLLFLISLLVIGMMDNGDVKKPPDEPESRYQLWYDEYSSPPVEADELPDEDAENYPKREDRD